MLISDADEMPLYSPPEKHWMLRLRSTEVFRAKIEDVVRLWRLYAELRGDDAKRIDMAYVVRRILEAGINQAFSEHGGRPINEEGWSAMRASIKKSINPNRKRRNTSPRFAEVSQ